MTTTYTDAQIKSLADSLHYCRDATLNDDAEDMLRSLLSERQAAMQGQGGDAAACPHHVRYPHPCRECEDGPMPDDFRSYPAHAGDKCFACGRAIGRLEQDHLVDTRDAQQVYVGSECYKKIKASGTEGWAPPKGGPRLWLIQPPQPVRSVSDEAWKDPTGFSVSGIRDEANNWTRRETGKEMLLNYAACLEHFAAIAQEKQL